MNTENDLLYKDKEKSPKKKSNSSESTGENSKNAELISILVELSNIKIGYRDVNRIIKKLNKIYSGDFRHSYYMISAEMYKKTAEQLDVLTSNLKFLVSRMDSKKVDTYNKTKKLLDHVQLETVRIKESAENKNEIKRISDNSQQELEKRMETFHQVLTIKNKEQQTIFDDYDKKLKDALQNIQGIYTQLISILGIFAAIVIVFFGGVSAFSNAFAAIESAGWQSTLPIVASVGIVIFNLVFMFLFIVARMVGRDIGVAVPENSQWANKSWITKIIYRYPYVMIFNLAMVVLFILAA